MLDQLPIYKLFSINIRTPEFDDMQVKTIARQCCDGYLERKDDVKRISAEISCTTGFAHFMTDRALAFDVNCKLF